MRAALRVEAIGYDSVQMMRLMCAQIGGTLGEINNHWWCARILSGGARQFIRGYPDHSRSNSKGSRGVYIIYTLDAGCVYEVKAPVAWGNTERYFCRVSEAGEIVRISKTEVEQWL